ncbi:hypothetical protein ILUMI_04500 [Ignelater luminosus]|uniref:Uncharacterized protein n=1 Tax=Ignelater luminosus TaxID=2038154 RepID=A0A8K0DEP1_IGNLU|nr:hypothetical protein ILUMI_04500 [Ignelater luminosus]
MNKPKVIAEKVITEKALRFGLSPIPVKVWHVRGPENKNTVVDKKKLIQDRFKKEIRFWLMFPHSKQVTQMMEIRFFRNAEKSAKITGVSVDLIKHFCTVLKTLNCGYPINTDAFEQYANNTENLYLKDYSCLLVSSDTFITSIRHISKRIKRALTRDVASSLTIPSLENIDHNDFTDSKDDEELPDSDTSENHSDIVDIKL